jgi:Na+/H+ antiporter NhaD/arsenite permease-like protein
MLLPESTHALFVGALLVVLFLSFVREWVKPDVAALSAVAVLLVAGLLSPAQVLGVFSNSAPFTIACLFIISGALSRTGCGYTQSKLKVLIEPRGSRVAHDCCFKYLTRSAKPNGW